jgi:CBS-domain-containing membrane protein
MMGAGLGVALSHIVPGDGTLWPLVCMAATLGGTMRAPLTATVFALGLTNDSNALLPLLATSATAYGFTVLTMRRSILTERIARRGYHIYREYGVDPLERHAVQEVMTRDVRTIDASASLAELMQTHFGPRQSHRAYPVVQSGVLLGVLDRADVVNAAAQPQLKTAADACAGKPLLYALPGDNCRAAAAMLARHGTERLPVVQDAQSLRLVGLVARSDLVKPSLAHFEEEERRERVAQPPWRAKA